MTTYTFPYGQTKLSFSIPDERRVEIIAPPLVPAHPDPQSEVRRAVQAAFGPNRDWDLPARVDSAVIAINDKTRPVPHQHLLPPLLEQLESLGLEPQQITLMIATGTHQPMTPDEFGKILPPELIARYPVVSHDCSATGELEYLGETRRGTPIWINRRYLQADLRVVIGNIEPHQFQGFSGGVKSAAIGLAGRQTINPNHAMMTLPAARLGEYDDNPARQDLEEIGHIIGVQLALNAILNQEKQIVKVLAGDPWQVMLAGIPLARKICQVSVPAPYDLILASPGGNPKDINVYQSQKGLAHAALVARDGATILLAAACPEGTGSQGYEDFVLQLQSFEEVFERVAQDGFRVGPHKAWQIARDASRVNVFLRSDMPPDFVRRLLLTPIPDLQTALDSLLLELPPEARIGIMPHANQTIPILEMPLPV
jgi:nickel-dependent lactate racemase